MNKYKVLGFVTGAAMLLAATPAFAASISDARFSNNQTTIDATGGATVNGTYTLTVNSGEVVEWQRNIPSGNPFTETSVGGSLGYQEGVYTNVPFTVKVPPNTGTYNVDVQGAGIYGGNRAINGGDNVVVGPTTVGQVRVVASTNDNNGGSNGDQAPSWFTTWLTAWNTNHPATGGSAATSAKCAALATKMLGTQDNVYNQANVMLQGYLLSEGASIPALTAGASFGFKGPQTNAALLAFKSANQCL